MTERTMRQWVPGIVACRFLAAAALLAALAGGSTAAGAVVAGEAKARACGTVGAWLDPGSGETLAPDQLIRLMAGRNVVLLGEVHPVADHHRWQLQVLAGLHAHRPRLVVGFEMFPRSVQPALDAWTRGQYVESEFLATARWREVWGYDAGLYLPLFHFVRQNRLPMVAMNVERSLVARVGDEGWSAVPEAEREGVSDPAPASAAYRQSLAQVYAAKLEQGVGAAPPGAGGHGGDEGEAAPTIAEILESDEFGRFVESQLTWDRALAEALFAARADHPGALVAGIVGQGHIEYGYGIPHQLADLGEDSVAVLLPVTAGEACESLGPDAADAVFVVAPAEGAVAGAPRPRLGIMIEGVDGGVRVLEVIGGSVAEATGLAAGDLIVAAAGFPLDGSAALIEIVQRQAPGTWLPLDVVRDGETREFVARFPTRFE